MIDPKEGRQVAVLEISGRTMFEMLRPDRVWWVEQHPLPEDAWLRGAEFDNIRGVWRFLVGSQSFDVVPDNEVPPTLPSMRLHIEIRQESMNATT